MKNKEPYLPKSPMEVIRELSTIPEQLWSIFLAKTNEELRQYETNIISRQVGRAERKQAEKLRIFHEKTLDLPLKSRRLSLHYLKIKIAILLLKKKMKEQWKSADFDDSEGIK